MVKKYTLERLRSEFLEHAKHFEKENVELIERYKRDYPGEELPDHLKDDFNLSYALHDMCNELINLKEMK